MMRNHPWFDVTSLTAGKSAGKRYGDAVQWLLPDGVPENLKYLMINPSSPDAGGAITLAELLTAEGYL